jgi:DNA-binding response OmpR family regulator
MVANKYSAAQILIIDDDPDMLELICLVLADFDNKRCATSGPEGLRLASELRPDLIILDVMMPDLDGMATCELLRQDVRLASVPIIFLSARRDTPTAVASFHAGGNDYVTKPIRRAELLRRVDEQLSKSPPR